MKDESQKPSYNNYIDWLPFNLSAGSFGVSASRDDNLLDWNDLLELSTQ